MNKKFLTGLTASLLFFCMAIAACKEDKPVASTSPSESVSTGNSTGSDSDGNSSSGEEVTLTLSKREVSLLVGGTETVTAAVAGTTDAVAWESSDASVATVDGGVITAVGAGTATITASVGGEEVTVTVTVANTVLFSVEQNAFELNPAVWTDSNGNSYGKTSATISPKLLVNGVDTTDATITYKSADKRVATVSDSGVITAVGNGLTKITATCTLAGEEYEAEVSVNVAKVSIQSEVSFTFGGDKSKWTIDVAKLGFDPMDVLSIYLKNLAGDEFVETNDLGEIVFEGTCAKVKGDDIDIASKIEPDEVVVETEEVEINFQVVYVTEDNVTLVSEVSPLYIGQEKQLEMYIFGVKANIEDEIEWSVNKEQIVTVDQTGKITAVNYGTVIVSARVYGYTFTTRQVVYKHEEIKQENVSQIVDGTVAAAKGYKLNTHDDYEAGDWISFSLTPTEDVTHGMLYLYYGQHGLEPGISVETRYPNGVWFATAGINNFHASKWTDESFIVLDSNGKKLGSITDEVGLGTLTANETYTVYVQIPNDGAKDNDFYFSFVNKEQELSENYVGSGVIQWRNFSNVDVEISVNEFTGFKYNGETREEITQDGKYTYRVDELAEENELDISALGITQPILSAKITGMEKYDVFKLDETGAPLVSENKLTLFGNYYTKAGTDGETTLVIETEDYRYIVAFEIIPTSAKFTEIKYLEDGGANTIFLLGEEVVSSIQDGKNYLAIDFYLTEPISKSKYLFFQVGQRHIYIQDNRIYYNSADGMWQPVGNIQDSAKIYDANGTLVNDVNHLATGKIYGNTATGTLQTGVWYTLVLDMAGAKYNSDETCIASSKDNSAMMRAVGLDAYVGRVSAVAEGEWIAIRLDKANKTLNGGEEVTLTPILSNSNQGGTVTWSSSNEAVATVDEDGKVTAIAAGKAVITATVNGHTATCTIEVLAGTVEIDEKQIFNYADIATDNAWDLKPLGITEEIFSVSVEGTDKVIFVTDSNGIKYADNKLLIADNMDTVAGIDNVTVIVKTEQATYRIPFQIVAASENFKDAQLLQENAEKRTLLMGGIAMMDNVAEGKNLVSVKFYVTEDLSSTVRLYITMGQRHIAIQNDRIVIPSWVGGWQTDANNITATVARIYDENGVLVNDTIYNGGGGQAHGTVAGTVEKGKWYTLVCDMNCIFAPEDTLRSDDAGSGFDMGAQGTYAYVTDVKASATVEELFATQE